MLYKVRWLLRFHRLRKEYQCFSLLLSLSVSLSLFLSSLYLSLFLYSFFLTSLSLYHMFLMFFVMDIRKTVSNPSFILVRTPETLQTREKNHRHSKKRSCLLKEQKRFWNCKNQKWMKLLKRKKNRDCTRLFIVLNWHPRHLYNFYVILGEF